MFKDLSPLILMLKFNKPLWPHPIPENHDFNNPEFTISEDGSTQVSTFPADWFKKKEF